MLPFLALIGLLMLLCMILSIWIGGPEPYDWPAEWGPRPDNCDTVEIKAGLAMRDDTGLVHTDDLRP